MLPSAVWGGVQGGADGARWALEKGRWKPSVLSHSHGAASGEGRGNAPTPSGARPVGSFWSEGCDWCEYAEFLEQLSALRVVLLFWR